MQVRIAGGHGHLLGREGGGGQDMGRGLHLLGREGPAGPAEGVLASAWVCAWGLCRGLCGANLQPIQNVRYVRAGRSEAWVEGDTEGGAGLRLAHSNTARSRGYKQPTAFPHSALHAVTIAVAVTVYLRGEQRLLGAVVVADERGQLLAWLPVVAAAARIHPAAREP